MQSSDRETGSNVTWKLGIDVGGTFTDGILYNSQGDTYRAKTLSTPQNQALGVMHTITQLRSLVPDGETLVLPSLHHGTTVATNALLEGKGAKVALIVTEGFRDILVTRRSQVPGGLGAWVIYPKQQPLALLELTVEVRGRIAIDGSEICPFEDGDSFRKKLQPLKAHKPEAITVSLINSFANASHENAAMAILQDKFPGIPVSLSSVILPELMEYERTLTSVVSAMVRPKVAMYLDSLQAQLKDTEVRILRSDGGLTSPDLAKENSCNLLYSGPAGGVAGVAAIVAKKTKYKNLLTFDMGGTSTDVCLIQNGLPSIRVITWVTRDCDMSIDSGTRTLLLAV